MKFQKAKGSDVTGTSYQGSIMTSLEHLKNVFGTVHYHDSDTDSKTRNEYLIEFDNGTVATIYDYKEYRAYHDDEILEFHVGGFSKAALSLVNSTV